MQRTLQSCVVTPCALVSNKGGVVPAGRRVNTPAVGTAGGTANAAAITYLVMPTWLTVIAPRWRQLLEPFVAVLTMRSATATRPASTVVKLGIGKLSLSHACHARRGGCCLPTSSLAVCAGYATTARRCGGSEVSAADCGACAELANFAEIGQVVADCGSGGGNHG